MYENLQNIEDFYRFINVHDLAVVHIMRDNCTVCHAVLPQIQDLLKDYPKAQFLIFFNGKEMHRQARFIDMQSFEKQLYMMQNAID
ncbi:MAG: thioredoxin family protein [Staphylococcus epidermidis]|nr:thioredoxin family protein [Staphylococcus epidermidis]